MTSADWIASLTCLVTVIGITIAWRAYRNQIAMMEPWELTKVEEGLWLLKRTSPKLATIYGITGGELGDIFHASFLNPAAQPTTYFKNGTNILIKVDSSSSQMPFFVCYQEHKREKYPFKQSYRQLGLIDLASLPPRVKVWSTYIY